MMDLGGAVPMPRAVRQAVAGLAAEVARAAGITPELILEATVVGNPIMHHLVLGIDPVELGRAPFALAIDRALTVTAAEIGVSPHSNARVYFLPCLAGHVGADTVGEMLSEPPRMSDQI